MSRIKKRSLEEAVHDVQGALVLLDVDGTIVADGESEVSEETKDALRILSTHNEVYLVSNGSDRQRVEDLSRMLAIPIAPAGVPAGKPYTRAAAGIARSSSAVVVIGDKYLTDGLFARALSARFVPITRQRSGRERFTVKISYWLERVVSWIV